MSSLHEQLLKAGLVDKKKVKQVGHDKSKQKKAERATGTQSVDEARLVALDAQHRNLERTRETNDQRDAIDRQKAIMTQITQMVRQSSQNKGAGDNAKNYIGKATRRERVGKKG